MTVFLGLVGLEIGGWGVYMSVLAPVEPNQDDARIDRVPDTNQLDVDEAQGFKQQTIVSNRRSECRWK